MAGWGIFLLVVATWAAVPYGGADLAYGVGTSSNRRGANSFAAGAGGAVTGDRSMPAMYGGYKPELLPRMFGLDQCARYRSTVAFADRKWGVAGLHNTGTNLLFRTMTQNCKVRRRHRDSGSGDANVNVAVVLICSHVQRRCIRFPRACTLGATSDKLKNKIGKCLGESIARLTGEADFGGRIRNTPSTGTHRECCHS
eukprot:gene21672-21777_t